MSGELELELAVGGMTCASCAARVEKKLNRLPGVAASVNYATERATVTTGQEVSVAQLVAAVESAGYTAEPIVTTPPTSERLDGSSGGEAGEVGKAVGARQAADAAALRTLRGRTIGSAALTVPVMLLSMVPALQFDNWQWLVLTLSAPVAVWGAWPFHRAAAINLRHGAVTMDTLVSIGVLAAFGWSLWALFFGHAGMPGMRMGFSWFAEPGAASHEIYLETAAAVTVFMLAGRYAEARAKRSSVAAIRALLDLGAREATVIRDGREVRVPIAALAVGDRFVVRPGEKVATDGIVEEGASAVDRSLLTGESVPVEVTAGDPIEGSTLNVDGVLVVRATRVGADTALARVTRLVEQAQSGKASVQRLADRVSAVFVPIVIGLAAVAFAAWLAFGPSLEAAFTAAVATLIVACPCALGLATPMALLVGTARGSQLGVLIKGPQVLERTRRVDTVLLDKTGTVTEGRMRVTGVATDAATDADQVLALAAATESGSEHPIARAVMRAAHERALALGSAGGFTAVRGFGVRAEVDGITVFAGRPAWVQAVVAGVDATAALDAAAPQASRAASEQLPEELAAAVQAAEAEGATVVAVGWDGRTRGIVVVADTVRSSSAAAVRRLRELGLTPVLATGDNEHAARSVAASVGIEQVHASMTPESKLELVRALQAQGKVVAMVGDGVNDAAALAASDLGIAMGGGTDAAIEAGDLTLVRGDLAGVVDAIRLSRRTLATIKGNLFWAFAYNIAAIPLAMTGLLNPLIAGAAMALSSLFVVTNSLRLRRFRPTG